MNSEGAKYVSIIGLPGSGKTTFLAAFWHLVQEQGLELSLRFEGLKNGNYEHLNALTDRWLAGQIQKRTITIGNKAVSMHLRDQDDQPILLEFPDVAGETFRDMWELREVPHELEETLAAPAVALLVNGDTIRVPLWISDLNHLAAKVAPEGGQPTGATMDWEPRMAPTQVQLTDILQVLMNPQFRIGPRRLAILVSAWDAVAEEGLSPSEFVKQRLPLLHQYLVSGRDPWEYEVFGISAQGGEYEDPDKDEEIAETGELLDLDRPSDRISVVQKDDESHDLTKPVRWLTR